MGINAMDSKTRWHTCRHRTKHRKWIIQWGPVTMKRTPMIFLQVVIVLIGMGALAVMLWAPHLEGRNVHASLFQVYFNDPLLACAYIASVPFFVALYQAFILLGHIGRNKVFLPDSVRALRIIKYCAMSLVALLLAAVIYFLIVVRGQDDIAGGVAISIFLIFVSTVVAAAASVLETTLQNTFDRSEGDLTA